MLVGTMELYTFEIKLIDLFTTFKHDKNKHRREKRKKKKKEHGRDNLIHIILSFEEKGSRAYGLVLNGAGGKSKRGSSVLGEA
jgi:hypothetical protein